MLFVCFIVWFRLRLFVLYFACSCLNAFLRGFALVRFVGMLFFTGCDFVDLFCAGLVLYYLTCGLIVELLNLIVI